MPTVRGGVDWEEDELGGVLRLSQDFSRHSLCVAKPMCYPTALPGTRGQPTPQPCVPLAQPAGHPTMAFDLCLFTSPAHVSRRPVCEIGAGCLFPLLK